MSFLNRYELIAVELQKIGLTYFAGCHRRNLDKFDRARDVTHIVTVTVLDPDIVIYNKRAS
jgi:hypothetical protein